jgi:hypothetical protein
VPPTAIAVALPVEVPAQRAGWWVTVAEIGGGWVMVAVEEVVHPAASVTVTV